MNEIKLYKSPWKALQLILISSVFVALGIWGATTGHMPAFLAWLNIGLFGLALLVGFFHLLDRRPQIIINEIGIFDRTTHKDFINWEILSDAYLVKIYDQHFICLVVDEKFKPSKNKSKFRQHVAKLNDFVGTQELNISLGQIKIDPKKLTEFIVLMKDAHSTSHKNLLAKFH